MQVGVLGEEKSHKFGRGVVRASLISRMRRHFHFVAQQVWSGGRAQLG